MIDKELHMAIQACTGNTRKRGPELLDCPCFVHQEVLKNPRPHGVHYDFFHFHPVSPRF